MNIKLHLNTRSYFKYSLEILKDFPPFSKLRNRERGLLAEFLYHNYRLEAEGKTKNEKNRILFDYDIRSIICEDLDISRANLYNTTKELKKKKVIGDHELIDGIVKLINPNTNPNINFILIDEK